ncbi:hypothetical protein QVD17_20872 [Tagetes erecta]|uniref:FBD domain-containing protein n=1 Tax=Tagetes erecta TaxID=13708 RepID=A0AAD8KM14_TARER|nr:hypothetical protein QVD17_20872 [Tagetes erecta]
MRTSTLSKNWRFKWTMLTQLIFDENFFIYLSDTNDEKNYGRIISMFLLHLKGDITKFVLYIGGSCYSVLAEDISLWILFLSKKGVKDLTLDKRHSLPLKLSTHLFSCLELKHLKLVSGRFDPPTSFHGFPNLLSLELCSVYFESGKFGEFFTRCPELEILNMGCPFTGGRRFPEGKVKLVEIAKLANLKILSLSLCNLENTINTSIIFQLVGFLPKLQELHLDFRKCKFTVEDGAKKCLPTTLPRLKALKLSTIDLGDNWMSSCTFEMVRSFSDLHTLEITSNLDAVPIPTTCFLEIDYDTMGMLQLRSIVFTYCKGSENEIRLIKYLLACSPFLKEIVIRPYTRLSVAEKYIFSRKLLKLYRASSVVDIELS